MRRWAPLTVLCLLAVLGALACGGGGSKLPADPPIAAQGLDAFTPRLIESEKAVSCTIGGWGLATVGRDARVVFRADAGTPFDGGRFAVKEVLGRIASSTRITFQTPVFGTSVRVDPSVEVVLPDGTSLALPAPVEPDIWPPTLAEPGMFDHTPVPGEMLSATGDGFGPIDGEISFVLEALVGTPFGGGDLSTLVVPGRVTQEGGAEARLAPEPITASFEARMSILFPSGARARGPLVSFAPGVFLTSPTTGVETGFGTSCAIEGGTAIIGAPAEEAAYVHVRGTGGWARQGTLAPIGGSAGDLFGGSVDIDGDTAVVGATSDGAVYVFERTGSTWSQVAKFGGGGILGFGADVAVSGDLLAVAQRTLPGAVHVYARTAGTWSFDQTLLPSDGGGRAFGYAVAVEGNTVAVGAPQDDTKGTDAGAVYVFDRAGGSWALPEKLLAPDGSAYDVLGSDVSLASHVVVAGAPGDTGTGHPTGAAHVFVRLGFTWTREATLSDPTGGPTQLYGVSVAVSDVRVAVGAPSDGGTPGVVFVYDRAPNAWTWSRSATLETWWPGASDERHGQAIGFDVDDVVVGAPIPGGQGFGCIY